MNIFICHTPLHVLLASLELPTLGESKTLFFIIEDAQQIHTLALALLNTPQTHFVMLPGTATASGTLGLKTSIEKHNFNEIRRIALKTTPSKIFVFFDQRAEAQALLNIAFRTKPEATLVEDGVFTLSLATPFQDSFRRLVKNKLKFDIKWKGSRWLGQHPAISSIRCFYPEFLRKDLLTKDIVYLQRELPSISLEKFSELYGKPKYNDRVGVIAIPHPDSRKHPFDLAKYVQQAISYCKINSLKPVFKFHPRDAVTDQDQLFLDYRDVVVADKSLPVELMFYTEPKVRSIIGYRTSALHVTLALHPQVKVIGYEPSDSVDRKQWTNFYENIGVEMLLDRVPL